MAIPANARLKAFAATVNPAAAKVFYQDILGLKLLSEDDYALEFEANGTRLRIAAVKEFTPFPFTVLGWDVDDIKGTAASLTHKSVVFEKYGFLEQDELGIWTAPGGVKVAWFKDPDGNVLSLSQ
ncbi:VOC family protein [Mucilaginibacter sp. SP1R1]|uniref:VOC family protein n=1 Tax=Mucilaginibacter sp. SP1R1 TaxID=2723091 RepID=UPI0016214FFB|nr:VOC family protein [Mucilaginibacter sp. SP1R1]MBB6152269.1 catechol 2,3-dioxygenase-like lactoylglutathione lyase family enzyme [Mucilaginibacter sp. SP1R1]